MEDRVLVALLALFALALLMAYWVYARVKNENAQIVQALRNELNLLNAAFESQEAAFITDDRARIVRINHAFTLVTGYEAAQALGRTPKLLRSGMHDDAFYRDMFEALRIDGFWKGEVLNRRSNGEVYPQYLRIRVVSTAQGDRHYIAQFRDISEQVQAQRDLEQARLQAEQASQSKSRFLASMSHEIRTPLNAIINMNELLLDTPLDSTQSLYVHTMREAGYNMLTLVNNILDFSKAEAGCLEPFLRPCQPMKIVQQVCRLLSYRAWSKGLELTIVAYPKVPLECRSDSELLRRILINLIDNAIKFTHSGGVEVLIDHIDDMNGARGPHLKIEVRDSGIGISDDKLDSLFDEFSQVHVAAQNTGTGLGLSICHTIAQSLGGQLQVSSTVDEGSCFRLHVPLDDESGAQPLLSPLSPAQAQLLSEASLCIRGHNNFLIGSLMHQLLLWGCRVVQRHDAMPDLEVQALIECCTSEMISPVVRLVREENATEALTLPYLPSTLRHALVEGVLRAQQRTPPTVQTPSTSSVLLLVEDSMANRIVAASMLRRAGYTVIEANHGFEALEVLRETTPIALILMDVSMPEMDGLEATRMIRAMNDPTRCHLPIIAMTAGAFAEDRQRCEAAGMNDYLPKPVVREDLLDRVAHWLSKCSQV